MVTKIYDRTAWFMVVYSALFMATLTLFVVTACLGELTAARYILLTIAGAVSAAGFVGIGWYGDAIHTAWYDHKFAAAELAALDRKIRDEESRAAMTRAAVRDFSLYVNEGLMFRAGSIFSDYYQSVVRGIDPYCKRRLMELRYGKAGHTNYLKLAIDQLRADYGL